MATALESIVQGGVLKAQARQAGVAPSLDELKRAQYSLKELLAVGAHTLDELRKAGVNAERGGKLACGPGRASPPDG